MGCNTNKCVKTDQKKRRRVSSISWRLFGALAIFIVMILIVIWIFQVVLLNIFYKKSKLDEFYRAESEIIEAVEDRDNLKRTVYSHSIDSDMCIRVFRVVDGNAEEMVSSRSNSGCVIHNISNEGLSRLYKKAGENDGRYIRKINNKTDDKQSSSTVYISAIERGDDKYILMFDSDLAPFNATVQTLEMQFGWIMFILIIGALIWALFVSRIICLPMKKMSRSARRLAKGDYGEHFEGGGYTEADELADALNFAASELAKNDNLQKELIANISHDLRTPLTMIKGYSEVMRDIPGENSPENVQVVIDESERLSELVNDVLDLSKIKAGMRKPDHEVFNLTETIRTVMLRYEKLTERDGYDISFESDIDVCVNADTTMILQVVYNLINNALNYTGEDKKVRIVQSVNEAVVRISVIDTGEGIEDDQLPYIWDRYYKIDKVHKRARVGTGLGLSIVKGILESHGADFGVDSQKGEGSCFWFELGISSFCAENE